MRWICCFVLVFVVVGTANGGEDPEVEKWIRILATEDEERPFQALGELIRLGEKSAKKAREVLRDENESVHRRWQAAKVLGAIKDEGAVADLLAAVNSRAAWEITAVGAEALGLIGDKSALPDLEKLLDKVTDPRVRPAIEEAVARLSGRTPPPRPTPAPPPAPKAAPDEFEKRFDWAPTLAEGLARAKREEKLLLTIVHAFQSDSVPAGMLDRSEVSWHALLRGPFTDPDLTEALRDRFVLAHVRLKIHAFSEDYPAASPDPLASIGAKCHDVDPPTILFTTADGELMDTLNGIGVFDARWLRAKLLRVLEAHDAAPKPPADRAKALYLAGEDENAWKALKLAWPPKRKVDPARLLLALKILHATGRHSDVKSDLDGMSAEEKGEALYLMADSAIALGDAATGERRLRVLAASSPQTVWSLKAAARLDPQGPDLALFEGYSYPRERDPESAVSSAVSFLVTRQKPDGSWRTGMTPREEFDTIAVTAIATAALADWPGEHSHQEAAYEKGLARVLEYAKRPGTIPTQVFNQTYALELVLDTLERDPGNEELKAAAKSLLKGLVAHQYPGGGWSYLTIEFGEARFGGARPHSFNTAPILDELCRAKKLGIEVPKVVIERATRSLAAMRGEGGAFMYTFPKGFQWMTKTRASIARDPGCELALLAAGEGSAERVADAVRRFHRHRADLEIPRKLYSSYFNRNGHGAYFWAFAYYYAAKALAHVPEEERAGLAADFKANLLGAMEADGTWIDSHATGKAYATAMVLRALALLR